eukprot:scaffold12_cov368-Pavlova_lutheri.AAC.1
MRTRQRSSTFRLAVPSTAVTRTHERTNANTRRRHYHRRLCATGEGGGRASATIQVRVDRSQALVQVRLVQVGSRTGDTCTRSELRLSAVVEVLEEADEARRSSRRTSRKVNCKAKRGTGGPSLKTTQWRLR